MNVFSLKGHKALVTASTAGIGGAIADLMGEAGAVVLRNGRSVPKGYSEKDRLLLADLSMPEAHGKLLEEAFAAEPELDLLVCNAGSFYDVPFLQMDKERFDKTISMNVEQTYFMAQGFAKRLVESKRPGSIIIISSTNGFQAEEDSTMYDVSKGALVMMTRTLAIALAPHGIRVNGVAPGLIRTPLSGWLDSKPHVVEHYEKKILTGRLGLPEDCSGACVFLASDAARYITGQVIVVDGGLTVGQIGRM